jgi:hypothetical protein
MDACSDMDVAVSSCLAVVGKLADLVVHIHTPLPSTIWLPTMRSLQKSDLGTAGRPLRVTVGAHLATKLQSLRLRGSHVAFEAAARLPTSLTYLFVRDDTSPEMPAQVGCVCQHRCPADTCLVPLSRRRACRQIANGLQCTPQCSILWLAAGPACRCRCYPK